MNYRKQTLISTLLIVVPAGFLLALAVVLSITEFTIGVLIFLCYGAFVLAYHFAEKADRLGQDVNDLELQLNNVLTDSSADNVVLVHHWYRLWSSTELDVIPTPDPWDSVLSQTFHTRGVN